MTNSRRARQHDLAGEQEYFDSLVPFTPATTATTARLSPRERNLAHTALVNEIHASFNDVPWCTPLKINSSTPPSIYGIPIKAAPEGFSDLLLVIDLGLIAFIEAKTGEARLRKSQELFRDLVTRHGHFYAIARSVADAHAAAHRCRMGLKS